MSSIATPANLKLLADLGLTIAQVAAPGSGSAVQLGAIAAAGIIDLYDKLIAAKPADVTVEEWRALLTNPIHKPGVVDDLVNEARKRLDATP